MSDIGIILTGQSLAQGGQDDPHVYTDLQTPSATERCFMLGAQPVGRDAETLSSTVSLLAEDEQPTIGHSMTHSIATAQPGDRVFFHGQSYGGKDYDELKKGAAYGVYEKIMDQVDDILAYAPDTVYHCVCVIHGEADGTELNHFYYKDVAEWLADFNADVKAKTGQSSNLFLIHSQVNCACGYGHVGGILSTVFPSALSQLEAHEQYNGIVLACPKYFLTYVDTAHISDESERILGEYYYKAYAHYVLYGYYNPLKPAKIYKDGSSVVIIFTGAIGGLSFDTTLVSEATNYGFAYHDLSGRTITGVEIVQNTVVITLSGAVGDNAWISYAYQNGTSGEAAQIAGNGERGNLRDNDPAVSLYDGGHLYNWCVTFKKMVETKNVSIMLNPA
jgi:hypothetical protein